MLMDYAWITVRHMDLLGIQLEDLQVDFALRPCALTYTQDYSLSSSMFS